ncbi:MAG: recombinase family protein [Pseudomonadota bacterium]
MKSRKAYSYIRMSSDIQLKGDSLRRQLEASEDYAKNNNLDLVTDIDGVLLRDLGVSGFKGKNAQKGVLSKFLEALELGRIEKNSILLIESLDRLSREKLSDAIPQFLDILKKGIEIVTLTDNQRYTKHYIDNNPGAIFISLGIMFRANEESEIKSKRLSAAWSNKRNNAKTKVMTKTCPAWMEYDKDTEKFVIVPERGEVVKKIFDMCINTCGLYAIARHLNETNTPQFGNGRIWYLSYVRKIINNRSVIGELSPHHYVDGVRQKIGDPIADYYPKIVDEQTFLLAHVAISKRSTIGKGRKGTTFTNVFSGLMHCGLCGFKVMLKNHNSISKSGRYLTCSNKNVLGGCQLPSWNLSEFEGMIFKHLREINFSDLISTSSDDNKVSLDDQMSVVISKKMSKEEELKRTIDFSTENDLSENIKKMYVTKQNLLDQEISQLESEINNIKKLIDDQQATEKLFNADDIKQLINKIEENQNDYLFRSTLNQYLTKLILKIELFYDQNHIQPWEFDIDADIVDSTDNVNSTDPDKDGVFIAFRKTFKSRSHLSLEEIIKHPDFDLFNRNYNRFVRITYRTGIVRELYTGSNSSFVHKQDKSVKH